MTRESIPLTTARRIALERLAKRHRSIAGRGPNAGQPSWRALIYQLADGHLTLTRRRRTPAPGRREDWAALDWSQPRLEIARQMGVSVSAVQAWRKKLNP